MSDQGEPIRVILKDRTVVEYTADIVERIEIDTGSTTWWLEAPQAVWWRPLTPEVHLLGMGAHDRTPCIHPEAGNSWWLGELPNGYSSKETD